VQFTNVKLFKIVIELGILIDVRAVQVEKAPPPILVTPEGITIDLRELLAKAVSRMLKSPGGRITDVNEVQPENEST